MTEPRIEILDDAESLARAVAGELLARLAAAQTGGDDPQIALTGGSIADRIHRQLAELGTPSPVDWSRVGVWWGDERFVAADSPERNAGQARRALLDHVAVAADHVHEAPATDHAASVVEAAAAYDQELRRHLRAGFEVVMLGVGPDGHVASLFPGHPALDEAEHLAVAVTGSPKPPPERISLTFAALAQGRAVWFVVSGEDKAEAVARALAAHGDVKDTPARGVGHDAAEVVWFLDRAAASQL